MASPRRSTSTARGRISPSTLRCWADRQPGRGVGARSSRRVGSRPHDRIESSRARRARDDQVGQEGSSGRRGVGVLPESRCGGPRAKFCARRAGNGPRPRHRRERLPQIWAPGRNCAARRRTPWISQRRSKRMASRRSPFLDGRSLGQRIVDAMNDLIKNSKKGDLVIISYAGHGMQTPEYPRWKGLSRNGVSEQIALSNFSFSGPGAGEIIVNIEMRAWLSRLDAKGVDTVLVMDSCFGGGMRGVDPRSGELRVREVKGAGDAAVREKFTGIPMTDKEARGRCRSMPHVTFLSGATPNSVVPEMPGLQRSSASEGRSELLRRSRPGRAPRPAASSHARACSSSCSRTSDSRQTGDKPSISSREAPNRRFLGNRSSLW